MSDSTPQLDILTTNAQQEAGANALFNAASPSMLFGRRESTTSGLVWGYYGGKVLISGVVTAIVVGTVTLTANQTNYIEVTQAGAVSANPTGFTAGRIPLYTAVAGASTITSYTDQRVVDVANPRAAIVMGSDASLTLTNPQARALILDITSGVSLTATRNIVLPLSPQQWTVANLTTGAQALQFIGASGTGITIANGKRAIIYADGTNIVRATADV